MSTRKSTVHRSFNQKFLDGLKAPDEGRAVYYDEDNPDLGLRVEPSGRKTFFWFKKVDGRPMFKKIGSWSATDIDTARGHAHRLSAALDDFKRAGFKGENPFSKKKKAQVPVPSVEAMVEAYCAVHPRAEAVTRWMMRKYCGAWYKWKVDQVKLEHVLEVRNALGKKFHMANRVVERIRAIYNWASTDENGKVNLCVVLNPTRQVKLHNKKIHEPRRKTYLQPHELIRFNRALKTEAHADLRDFLVLAMATAARRSNVLGMEWKDFDFDTHIWRLPKTKTQPYNVTLTPAALKVLEARRARIEEDEPFVFPSFGATGHIVDLKKQWNRFRLDAKIPHIRCHDIRRTAGSYMSMSGASMKQIAEALGHSSTAQATECYSELAQEVVAEARLAGERKMRQLMKSSQRRSKKLAAPRARKLLKAING